MQPREAIAAIDRHAADLAEQLLTMIDRNRPGVAHNDAAAHQLVWRHYMVTGRRDIGDAVIASLRAICRASRVEIQMLGENAQLLELLTWVWRQIRCPELRSYAEAIATWAAERVRVPGLGFAARLGSDKVPADQNGLMLVALVEAGSVFERRNWLALTRDLFDEVAGRVDGWRLDDYVMMARAAVRLFEAFGKRRYLELAEAWVAVLDDACRSTDGRGYFTDRGKVGDPTGERCFLDATLPSGNALMIGILARLHALTGQARYADRADRLARSFLEMIPRPGLDAATAVAGGQTMARLVSIKVFGDPKLAETRALMRAALDHGLPDRLVLGPGSGDPAHAMPKAVVRVGSRCLAPIEDVATLRGLTAPGGLFGIVTG